MRNLTTIAGALQSAVAAHNEWLLDNGNDTFYLLSNEIRVELQDHSIVLSYLDDQGYRSQSLEEIKYKKDRIKVTLSETDSDSFVEIELVPRVKALDLRLSVEEARLEIVNDIGTKLTEQFTGLKIFRAALNEHNGRFAEIAVRVGFKNIAVLSDVAGGVTHEALLSKAFVWLRSLGRRKNQPITEIWIIADVKTSSALRALSACLNRTASAQLKIWKPAKEKAQADGKITNYEMLEPRSINSLWAGRLPKLSLLKEKSPTAFSEQLLELDPENIDRVYSAKGETLRYRGLPFARTRIMSGAEKIWFGIEREKIPLTEKSRPDFFELLDNLRRYRRHDSSNKQHEYFKASPEAWLESMLRRNIKSLDANLILSPIYNQFRAAREKIDLLALRRDGRLVIIELKVAPDREMVFQAVDYWRKVESQRKRGVLNKARLFGDAEISDRPTLIYLAAPTLGFHSDLSFLGSKVSSEIEIFRFDLAENWREGVRVIRRGRIFD